MKLLVLGGTRFLGRHLVEAALARGHEVTTFTRGRLPSPWPGRVTGLLGDRDPRIAPGLAALEGATWDAVVDCSGYVPRVVEAGARLLASRVARYLFVSSLSVYAETPRPNMDETTPVAKLADPATEQVMEHYGALKAACEAVVERIFGVRHRPLRLLGRALHPPRAARRSCRARRRAGAARASAAIHRCARPGGLDPRARRRRDGRYVQRVQPGVAVADG
jgi:2'-hydroxyisoflavone reductase